MNRALGIAWIIIFMSTISIILWAFDYNPDPTGFAKVWHKETCIGGVVYIRFPDNTLPKYKVDGSLVGCK